MSEAKNEASSGGEPQVRSTPLFGTWRPIAEIPKDGTPVLVCSHGMSWPEIAWHEETGATMRTYDFWMPLPDVPNIRDHQQPEVKP